jgi:hypothetical protein
MAEIYVPGPFDFVGTANALSQMQTAQQARQSNALQMQYDAEDRAREARERSAAAANALAARARAQKIAGVYEQGFNPGQTALMTPSIAPGPGVVRKAVEPSYDYTKTALQFLKMGETGKAEELFKLPEARREASAKGIEGDAKAQLAVLETSAKSYATSLANVKPVLDQAISIDGLLHYVDVVDADPVLGPLAIKTGGPTEARKEAIRKMAAPKEAGGGGMTVDQIAKRLSGVSGYDLAGMDIELRKKEADVAKTEAETLKARGEAGGAATGASVEERNRALFAKAMQDPNYPATAEYAALYNMSFGRKMVEVQDPNGPPGQMVNRIIDVPAPEGFPRPTFVQQQNALAPAAAAAQPTNALAMNAGGYGGAPMPTAQAPILGVDRRTGEGVITKQPAVSDAQIKEQARIKGKSDVTQILGTLLKDYDSLEEMKAIPSEDRSVAENVPAYLGATALGQEAGKAAGTKAQTLRTNVQSNARFLLTAIKNATGMSAQEMNSIPELQALQEAVTKPTQSIQSVRNIIANVDKLYGTGGLKIDVAPKTEAAPKTDDKPNIAKLSDIEHTAKINKLSVEEVKARVRAKGMTIEGE